MNKFIKLHLTWCGELDKFGAIKNTEIYLNLKDITYIQENGKIICLNNGTSIGVDEESFRRLLSVIENSII